MSDSNTRKRVLCPVEGKDKKTYWVRMGRGYINQDGSINIYLDCLPVNGRLQLRDWDEAPRGRSRQTEDLGSTLGGDGDRALPF